MKKFKKLLKWILLAFVVIILGLRIFLGTITLNYADDVITKDWGTQKFRPSVHYYTINNQRIKYITLGDTSLPVSLFIHGAPSSMSGWRAYINDSSILKQSQIIAVDRPGYGGSNFGIPIISIDKQAKALLPIIDSLVKKKTKISIIGSSYGGAVSARIAMLRPNVISRLILISSAVAPGEEKIFLISYPFRWPIIEWLMPPLLYIANEEKHHHKEALEEIAPDWDKIICPITIVHGNKDNLVYYENARFVKRKAINAKEIKTIVLPNHGHYIPWTYPSLVQQLVIEAAQWNKGKRIKIDYQKQIGN